MPFQSEKQRRFLWVHDPKVAERWAKETPKDTKLPTYVHHLKKKPKPDKES